MTRASGIWVSAILACAAIPVAAQAKTETPQVQAGAASAAPLATDGASTSGVPVVPVEVVADPEAAYWYRIPDDIDALVDPPDINLERNTKLWSGKARGNAIKGRKLRPAAWQSKNSDGRIVNLQTGSFSFDVTGIKAGTRNLTEAASLKLVLPSLTMDASLSASAGRADDTADLWHRNRAEVEMKVNALPRTEVTISGADEVAQTYREPGSLGVSVKRHVLQADKREARVAATVAVVDTVSLRVGASGTSEVTRDTTTLSQRDRIATKIENQTEELFANVQWTPTPGLTVDAGERERSFAVQWQGAETKNGAYRILEPHAAVTMNFQDAQLKTSIEHSASGYNTDAFVAYAANATRTESVAVEPDRAWRLKSEWKQQIGQAQLTANYSHSYDGTVTEFGFSGTGAQVPVSTSLDARDEVGVNLSVPLEDIGLADTSVSGGAVWRDSRVLDPVTGRYRRASGEVADTVTLRLERKVPGERVRFGLTGQMSASQTAYQTREITMVDSSNTLGAFIAYKPGAYEVNLDVDGLVGTAKTSNYYYVDSRAVNQLPKSSITSPPGPTVKLSLKRPF